MERRPWTPHEDQMLKNLYEKVKLNKWSLIARKMEEEFDLPPKTGKQCRERYCPSDPGITTTSTLPSPRRTGPAKRNSSSCSYTTNSATSGLSSQPGSEAGTLISTQHGQRSKEPLLRENAEGDAADQQDHPGKIQKTPQGTKTQRFIQDSGGKRGEVQKEPSLHPADLKKFMPYPAPHLVLKNRILAFSSNAPAELNN